jgi:Photosynthetic reaction centre cytochrome C subunit
MAKGLSRLSSAVAAVSMAWVLACHSPQPATPAPVAPAPPVAGGPVAMTLINQDSAADRDRQTQVLLQQIAGRDTLPAGEVFKNVTTGLKNVPARKFLAIMNIGYGRSLGVSCAHCHDVTAWESEDKPQKQIAREMARMDAAIIHDYLANIKNLKSKEPLVNCTTCHRGAVKPALDLK